MTVDRWRIAPVVAAAAGATLFLLLDPYPVDLAAHDFRAGLFERHGLAVWNGQWYGGHHVPGYSVVFPPLAALVGPQLVGVASCIAAAAAFEPLARGHFGHAARWGAVWFGAATATNLFTGRLPFALGVALGTAALLGAQRERRVVAGALAAGCGLASPVAGLFLSLAFVAWALAAPERRLPGIVLAALAIGPPLVLSAAFPEGGRFPFAFSAFFPLPLLAGAALLVLPRTQRTLRIAALLYGLGGAAAFVVDTPLGANVARLGALVGGPLLACALLAEKPARAPRWAIAVGLLALAVWQVGPAVRDTTDAFGDEASDRSYFRPLIDFLDERGPVPGRVEVVATKSHREASDVAENHPLARGWERQLDIARNGLFYGEQPLDDATYSRWLRENAVRFVALPDAALDYSAERERELVERDPPYLELRGRTEHWRIYEVVPAPALATGESGARVSASELGPEHVELNFQTPGSALVRVSFSPYWRARAGCVEKAGELTRVSAPEAGRVRLEIDFSPSRALARGRRCG